MKKAARNLVGIHDFETFGRPHTIGGSTIREVMSASWRRRGDELTFEIVGNAFLYHMVRHIVQFLVEIGQERQDQDAIRLHLQTPGGKPVQGLAPARGLSLMDVIYE
jgi:tRNA pseudouridine38-40 synthase